MANPATLYRFRIDISNIDAGVYETIDVRAAQHPSETADYLLTRVIAYALCFDPEQLPLEFSPGLCTGDEPAISRAGAQGRIDLWVDIGHPSARKLHKAAKAADHVRVFTHKNPELLVRECQAEKIHRASEIELYALETGFLRELGATLARDNSWALVHDGGELVLTAGANTWLTQVRQWSLSGSNASPS